MFSWLLVFVKVCILNRMINSSFEFYFAVANQVIRTTKISFSHISKSTSILILRLRPPLIKLYLNLISLLFLKFSVYIWPRFPAFVELRKPSGVQLHCYKVYNQYIFFGFILLVFFLPSKSIYLCFRDMIFCMLMIDINSPVTAGINM